MQDSNKIVIFSGPSGAGKSTMTHHTLSHFDNVDFSVSATTRKLRGKEVHGKDYYSLPIDKFKKYIEEDKFVEYEEVYPNQFYGTLKSELERMWNEGKTPIFDIDVIGALNVKKTYDSQVLTVLVSPPSLKVLEERLRKRDTEDEASIKKRIAKAKEELSQADKFDTILENDILEESLEKAEQLVRNFLGN